MTASCTQGADHPPLLTQTIGECLDATISRWPNRDALVSRHQKLRYTWKTFGEQVDRYARAFMALGLKKGDRVGMWGPNSAEWCITQFATAKAGIVMLNINPAYRSHELEYALKQSGCAWVVCAESFKTSNYPEILIELVPELRTSAPGEIHNERLPEFRGAIALAETAPAAGFLTWPALGTRAAETPPAAFTQRQGTLESNDPINIQYTSGTTGLPKGATLSHRNLVNNGYMVANSMGFTEADRLVIPVPLYHCFGMVMGNLGCVTHGAAMIYPAAGFEPEATLLAAAEEKATAIYGVPTMFIAELEILKHAPVDLSSVRTGIMAGSICPIEVMRQVIDKMNMKGVQIAYGQTETSPVTTQTSPDDDMEHRTTTVGVTQPHLESKLIDGNGNTVPRGTVGEYCTRGYAVMLGYWNDPETTAKTIDKDGWLHSGDLGVMGDDGAIRIVGRSKDMIIRGGENIYPIEIENFLYTHPAIADAQVFGIPSDKYGEEVAVWVKLRPGQSLDTDGLRRFCQQHIAHFKVPSHVKFVDEFPTTVTGKVQKFRMREAAAQELGLINKGHGADLRHA
ncbi:MAG: AMP-binding protein [Nevskiaceae bacterium]|nr:MAG: AMP-binding protein [Nevskiaceae bacterium]TBR72542.1 MAG: AMP-binding protein [Nevskiaceae bacterium]